MTRTIRASPIADQVIVDLRGTTFDPGLTQETLQILKGLRKGNPAFSCDFSNCVFTGHADFTAAVFGDHSRPQDDHFVDFTDARFDSEVVFTHVQFLGRTYFERTSFTSVTFEQTTFGDDTWFLRTRFGTAVFSDATFAGQAYFYDVAAESGLAFTGATFSGRTFLESVTTPNLDLTQAVFSQRATLYLSGGCVADYARFDDGVAVRLQQCTTSVSMLSLAGVRLGAPSTLTGATPPTTPGSAASRLPQLMSLAGADVAELTITDIDLGVCLFAGAINLDKLHMGGTTPFARPLRRSLLPGQGPARTRWQAVWRTVWRWCSRGNRPVGREMLMEELVARVGYVHALGQDRDTRSETSGRVTDDQVKGLYRALRKAREDVKDEPGAADFYLGEMEARRRGSRKTERLILTMYRALSGYGQRAGRALMWLVGLLAVLTVLLIGLGLPDTTGATQRITGTLEPAYPGGVPRDIAIEVRSPPVTLPPAGQRWTTDRLERATRIAVGSIVLRDTDLQLTSTGRWTVNTGRALGPLLLALAALAVRARVKR
ncbi:pentapeptide repeat-containing protein [Umezawaea sp. Da 62-37]|uniref:pentapeptide repeat-containing protein n=1 Tax=Umezawaea sp. Da 62-37 TaxID=3075927 RepID=UPI0028F6FE57|nr:pentapeptide repeat-containing protein [Umezawaea sp. Da 62-37]WNV84750.1 pentapeptide repeat-containing protein [Umezawaea sp. Da 62-37]